ncbi:MAG TPA: translation initiation factor IF-2 [Verrucomicrobiae bacterium]|jgi:translation initiation factor IF-2|nr:translation initiation factor IF-2 [Verrucomicrobiae bacterium]
MPVRIYDIAKKLGVESKDVLVKAKELGIAAKVPSSSLDKITAEFLEQQLAATLPHPASAAPVAPPPAPVPIPHTPINIISEPPPEEPAAVAPPAAEPAPEEAVAPEISHPAEPVAQPAPAPTHPAPVPEPPPVTAAEPAVTAPAPAPEAAVEIPKAPAAPVAPPPPPAPVTPPPPKVGDKVGFIQLTPKAAPRPAPDRGRPAPAPSRTDFNRRGDIRGVRGPTPPGAPAPGQRPPMRPGQRPGGPAAPPAKAPFVPPTTGTLITLKPPIIVRDLADQLKRKPFQIIADLMGLGVFANVNQSIDEEVAQKICAHYGFRFEVEKRERGGGTVHAPVKKVELDTEDKPEDMKPRAPVVTIMGHVDHGKTTLLDVIRKSDVAAGEAGGITQHIGAYTISFPHPERKGDLQQITFLDTPGHAAFSAMRARGANVTDIVVLVVAANDGVMPQTLEALSHAQAAKAPIIVAVNKCDHPNANPLKVRQQLQDKGLVPDDWGGDTIFADVSALTRLGVDKLLELILLQADLLELKANPNRRAKGNVIESGLEPGGPTATVLVRKGTLRVGDVVICGQYWGKVRALISEEGTRQKEAGPSVAVKILGLNGVPEAGLEFSVLEDERTARDLGEQRAMEARSITNEGRAKVTLENLFATLDATQAKTLKVVVKADTQGSVEAIVEALKKIEGTQVSLEVIHSAVGTITESDITLASASGAVVLGFHTRIDVGVADIAKSEGVQIKLYSIIYELIDHVKEAMAGLLDPVIKEVIIGSAEVRKIFALSKGGNVAGCMVNSGRIVRGKARILRRKGLIYEGVTQTLRRFQDEVNEVRAGMECGIRIEGFNEMQVGDVIECYTTEKVAPKA